MTHQTLAAPFFPLPGRPCPSSPPPEVSLYPKSTNYLTKVFEINDLRRSANLKLTLIKSGPIYNRPENEHPAEFPRLLIDIQPTSWYNGVFSGQCDHPKSKAADLQITQPT